MAIQGLRDTTNFVTDQRPKNWRQGILLLEPNGSAPLVALSNLMRTESTDDPEFNWWEKKVSEQRLALNADLGAPAAGTVETITVTGGADELASNHVLRVEETDEILFVNADPETATSIQVVRGYDGTAPVAVTHDASTVNPNIHVIGTAFEEGSDAPTGIARDPTKEFNYTQIFRNTLEATNTAIQTNLRTDDAVREAKREALQLHSMEMEKAFWFGERTEKTFKGKPIRTTRGVMNYIPAARQVDESGAAVDMENLEEDLKTAFEFGSSEKMAFAGNRALLTIQQIARKNSSLELVQGQREFGMNINRLVTPFGEVVIRTHPLFNQITSGVNPDGGGAFWTLDSWMFILDMQNFRFRPLRNRDTKFERDQANPGIDGMKSGYLTEAGIEVRHPETHYLIKGLRAAAVDT